METREQRLESALKIIHIWAKVALEHGDYDPWQELRDIEEKAKKALSDKEG